MDNNTENYTPEKQKYRLPSWVKVIGAVGLLFAVILGYYAGSRTPQIYEEIFSQLIIEDLNGENDTSLATLHFKNNIVYRYNDNNHNRFDSDFFALTYSTNAIYNGVKGISSNEFPGQKPVSVGASFTLMSHYNIPYVSTNISGRVNCTIDTNIKSGNMEAVLLAIDDNYTIDEDEYGNMVIPYKYYNQIEHFEANKEYDFSFTANLNYIYVLVFAGESASGSYHFTFDFEE